MMVIRSHGMGASCAINDLACLRSAMGMSPTVAPASFALPPSAAQDDETQSLVDELVGSVSNLGAPNALGYGAGGSGSVSDFFQGLINAGGVSTGQPSASSGGFVQWVKDNATLLTVSFGALGLVVALAKRR